jgi:hypothetical protein
MPLQQARRPVERLRRPPASGIARRPMGKAPAARGMPSRSRAPVAMAKAPAARGGLRQGMQAGMPGRLNKPPGRSESRLGKGTSGGLRRRPPIAALDQASRHNKRPRRPPPPPPALRPPLRPPSWQSPPHDTLQSRGLAQGNNQTRQ